MISLEVRKIFNCLLNMNFSIKHTYRENNIGADLLANWGCSEGKKFVVSDFLELPRKSRGILKE